MPKWDYRIEHITDDGFYCSQYAFWPDGMEVGSKEAYAAGGRHAIWSDIIELGEDGWELVSAWYDTKLNQAIGAFKRPLDEKNA